jgi:hypothetical protein
MPSPSSRSLAVCYPVWDRPDLFKASFASLERQLVGVEAGIWIFDNGSNVPTRQLIESLESQNHPLFKIFLPENMGIPFVVNMFHGMVTQNCSYTNHYAPSHVMLADADAYFKKPIRDMIEVLESNTHFAIISGHDSIEHPALAEHQMEAGTVTMTVKEKDVERGLCLIMRTEILGACVSIPHHRDRDVDWELMKWHPNSTSARSRKVPAVDYVAHIGLYDSTWLPTGVPADEAEIAEINQILEREGLLSPERRSRMEEYCRRFLS